MVRMDSFSSVPPHIQPPMAQVPSAIRELTRFVPSILMYSSIAFLSHCLVEDRHSVKPASREGRPLASALRQQDPNGLRFPSVESRPKSLAPLLRPIAWH